MELTAYSSESMTGLAKADPQGCGSALTYARRYELATIVNLVTADDDADAYVPDA